MVRQRYSYFLEFLLRTGRLDAHAEAGAHVTPTNMDHYLERLRSGVSSVTVYNSVHMLRRVAGIRWWGSRSKGNNQQPPIARQDHNLKVRRLKKSAPFTGAA